MFASLFIYCSISHPVNGFKYHISLFVSRNTTPLDHCNFHVLLYMLKAVITAEAIQCRTRVVMLYTILNFQWLQGTIKCLI